MYTYSIVIPHKNIPDLLVKCLETIPERKDLQIIIVDDNSNDADTYLEKYPILSRPNVDFIRTYEGKGSGYVRNVGLQHVKAKWVIIFDADDTVETDNFNKLLDIAADSPYKMIVWGTTRTRLNGESLTLLTDDSLPYDIISLKDIKLLRSMVETWIKMVDMDFVREHHLSFDETVKVYTDAMFHIYLMSAIKENEIGWYPHTIYNYIKRKGSLANTINLDTDISRMNTIIQGRKVAKANGWRFKEGGYGHYLWRIKSISKKHYYSYIWKDIATASLSDVVRHLIYGYHLEKKKAPFLLRYAFNIVSNLGTMKEKLRKTLLH